MSADVNHTRDSKMVLDVAGGSRQMRLLAWPRIWTTLYMTRIRGHNEIIDRFLRVLTDEALFDDRGAWY